MSEENSKLVEEVVNDTPATEENDLNKFNPLAFTQDEPTGEVGPIATETTTETTDESVETEEEEDGWSWEKKEKEESEVEEETYNWDGTEETNESGDEINWDLVSKQLGMEGASKDEIRESLNALNNKQEEPQTEEVSNEQIRTLETYLSFSNKDLVIEELKADGLTDDEIDDTVDKMMKNGMIALKGREIKRTIKNAIKQQRQDLVRETKQTKEEQNRRVQEARKGLQKQFKNMDRFMGGKITKQQKEEAYRFAVNSMSKELWSDHANVADVAMFMLYKDQIKDILRSQGRNEGSKSLMDKIQSPSLNTGRSRNTYQPKSKGFDPKAFMSE